MSNIKSNLPKELKEKVKQIVESGDDTKVWELLTRSVRCTIRDDGITDGGSTCNTLWDYLQVVAEYRNIGRPPLPEEKNTNFHTLVRLWGRDIHPLYADWLIVCTAEDLVKLVGAVKDEYPTPASLKEAYAELLKNVVKHAPQAVKILGCEGFRDDKVNSTPDKLKEAYATILRGVGHAPQAEKEYLMSQKAQDFKYAHYDIIMSLYVVKYLLLGKPFNLATQYSNDCLEYTLHEWYEPTKTMKCWNDFVKDRHERRYGELRKFTPKDKRPASYLLDDYGVRTLTEEETHDVMRKVRRTRKGKHPLVSTDEKHVLYPFDGMDYNCKRWSGIILSRIVAKTETDTNTKPAPNRDETIHTLMWDVFGQDTTKTEGQDFAVLFFNNQRRRDLAYEWMKGEPVVYDD